VVVHCQRLVVAVLSVLSIPLPHTNGLAIGLGDALRRHVFVLAERRSWFALQCCFIEAPSVSPNIGQQAGQKASIEACARLQANAGGGVSF
jgi:hypothetical protein